MFKNIREYENFHIVLWLLKDTCWVLSFKLVGMLMILPTLLVAVHITWKSRSQHSEVFHNIAICCWICANATWMTGEFFFNDGLRPFATVFFAIGLLAVGYYYFLKVFKTNKTEKLKGE